MSVDSRMPYTLTTVWEKRLRERFMDMGSVRKSDDLNTTTN